MMPPNRKGRKVCITPKHNPDERFCIQEIEYTETGENFLRFCYWVKEGQQFSNRPLMLYPDEWNELINKAKTSGLL